MARKNGLALQKQIDRAFVLAYWAVLLVTSALIVAAIVYTNTHNNYVTDEIITVSPKMADLETMSYSPDLEETDKPSTRENDIEDKYKTEAEYIAKTVWGEARGCSVTEQAAVVWCVLNRVDSHDPFFPDNIIDVITQPNQFAGYGDTNPVDGNIYDLVIDVLERWELEKSGTEDVGRVLPSDYLFFHGDGHHNYYRTDYESDDYWQFFISSPYAE